MAVDAILLDGSDIDDDDDALDEEPKGKGGRSAVSYSEGMSERTKSRRYAELDEAIATFAGMLGARVRYYLNFILQIKIHCSLRAGTGNV